jgi:hypothetical protein
MILARRLENGSVEILSGGREPLILNHDGLVELLKELRELDVYYDGLYGVIYDGERCDSAY